ncbi:MAG: ComEC/Rec2 family competence protein [Alphaproteobacteria bacterium]|nr:ComEC/Rec2 family competence protein [Alphaproteobacteria bacterium]
MIFSVSAAKAISDFVSSSLSEESPRLFLWTPVVLGVGIGYYFGWPFEPDIFFSAFATLLAGVGAFFARKSLSAKALFLVLLGFTLMCGASRIYGTPVLDRQYGPVLVEGSIVDIEQHRSGKRLLLDDLNIDKLQPERTPRRIHLVLSERAARQENLDALRPGMRVSAIAQLLPLSEPLSPGGFDFRRNGFFRGIGATGYVMGKFMAEKNVAQENEPTVLINQLRQNLQKEIKRTLSGDQAGLAAIFLTGDKTFLSPETAEAMRAVGLAHLLAIAGLHIGLVAGFTFFLFRGLFAMFPALVLRFNMKKVSALLALAAITFYMLQVGAPVPTRRALLMTGLVLVGVMFDRVSVSLRTVAMAALIILLIWPYLMINPGFQLSFAAVIGIISMHEWGRRKGWAVFPDRQGWLWSFSRHAVSLAVMSFVATIATLPLCLYHFQEAGIYSMLANTLAIPLTSFYIMPLCVFVDILWPFGLASWPLLLLEPGINLLIGISQNIADLPGAYYTPPPMSVGLLIAATLGGLAFCFMINRLRWAGLAVMLVSIALTFMSPRPSILISPDGHEIGWKNNASLRLTIISDEKPDDFLAEYWSHLLGSGKDNLEFTNSNPDLNCDDMGCVWKGGAQTIAWVKDPAIMNEECAMNHALIINPQSDLVCPGGTPAVISRATIKERGAQAIYINGDALRIKSERNGEALRPWSVGWR